MNHVYAYLSYSGWMRGKQVMDGYWRAAEVAVLCSPRVSRLVLIAPIGLWREDAPIPDIFTMDPQALAPLVWADTESPAAQAMLAQPDSQEEMARRMIERAQALAAAGKFIWSRSPTHHTW